MMKSFLAVAIVTLSAATMQAALTVPSGVWNAVDTTGPPPPAGNPTTLFEKIVSPVNNNGGPTAYWNNETDDTPGLTAGGLCRNIGCFVTGVDNTAGNNTPNWNTADPVYLAKGGANAGEQLQNFYFSATPSAPAVLLERIAGFTGTNWVGWFDETFVGTFNDLNRGSKWDILFTGDPATPTSIVFTPPLNFGIWMLPGFSSTDNAANRTAAGAALNTGAARFSESTRNTGLGVTNELLATGEKKQYFTVFGQTLAQAQSGAAKFIVGIEDSFAGDNDYNDLVFALSVATVIPEPGYYALLSVGLLGLGLARRRMNKKAVN